MNSKEIAIKVENLSKLYRIGLKENMHDSFGGAIFDFIKRPLKNYRKYRSLYNFGDIDPVQDQDAHNNSSDIIWALKEVSFDVKRGEVLGIIGGNGAGKSTLLKILCRITDPTSGRSEIRGRVSSLLEVGTGFHPELTGRENIYLNGTILGMTKKEMDRKFDEIVDFSGVEKFIDTPAKRYSSGMKVRLAFSVAAHLEPEILIIDEVLAVGDAEFQKKCFGKMENVASEGRTILFVSHNMTAVSALCPNTILLRDGSINFQGQTTEAIRRYLSVLQDVPNKPIAQRTDRQGNEAVRILDLWLENGDGRRLTQIGCSEKGSFMLSYRANQSHGSLRFIIAVYNENNFRVLRFDSDINPISQGRWPSAGIVSCTLCSPFALCPGQYRVDVAVFAFSVLADNVVNAMMLDVTESDFFGTGKLHKVWPMFLVANKWGIEQSWTQDQL